MQTIAIEYFNQIFLVNMSNDIYQRIKMLIIVILQPD